MEEEKLAELNDQMAICTKCPLFINRINVVPGEGNPKAQIMFVGEAPGTEENKQGRPFVGAAGKYLDTLLALVGWERSSVFITSIVKDQPPGNRDPKREEIAICTQAWLEPQLEIIQPRIIVPLGRHALHYFLPDSPSISEVHGQSIQGKDGRLYFPLYHPAAVLYRRDLAPTLEADFQKLALVARDYFAK